MITRETILLPILKKEKQVILELSIKNKKKPRPGFEEDWKVSKERIVLLEQMIDEQPVDCIEDEFAGTAKQVFIGTFDEKPAFFRNSKCKFGLDLLIYMNIAGSTKEGHHDVRLLRLCYRTYNKWFESGKYEREMKKRAEENRNTNIKAIVMNDKIRVLRWINRRKW